MEKYRDRNTGVVEYRQDNTGGRNYISYIRISLLDGYVKEIEEGIKTLDVFMDFCMTERVSLLFAWDFNNFGMFLDTWAMRKGIPLYEKGKTNTTDYGSVCEECWSAFYSGKNGIMKFRVTLERKVSSHRTGKKTGGYHSLEIRGLSPYFGGLGLEHVIRGCWGSEAPNNALCELLRYCVECYEEITGEKFLSVNFLAGCFSSGKAGQDLYLKLKYGKRSLSFYQKAHPVDRGVEDYYRERRLLMGGICYKSVKSDPILYHRKPDTPIYKYDVNGLYTHISNECGELGGVEPSSWEEYEKDKNNPDYTYILTIKNLNMVCYKHMANVFTDPFKNLDEREIDMSGTEYSLFGELFEALKDYYDIWDFDVVNVVKCRKYKDKALEEYNAAILAYKDRARKERNAGLYAISKLFLNALLGRFSASQTYYEYIPEYDRDDDIVRFSLGGIIDKWETHHFDYIRGAYIYTMARVKIMKDGVKFFGNKQDRYWWYTDTDSIVTPKKIDDIEISSTECGKYKVEEEYTEFGIIAKKTYYGRLVSGEDKFTLAGIPKDKYAAMVKDSLGEDLTAAQVFGYMISGETHKLAIRTRGCGGGGVVWSEFIVGKQAILDYI